MRWPWQREPVRPARLGDYTDAAILAALQAAHAPPAWSAAAAGAVVASSAMTGLAFAAAVVETARPAVAAALTPDVLRDLGDRLIARGEFVAVPEFAGRLRLDQPDVVEWLGGPDDARLRLRRSGPDRGVERILPLADVVHIVYRRDPGGLRGVAPWWSAAAEALGALEASARDEAGGPLGKTHPIAYEGGAVEANETFRAVDRHTLGDVRRARGDVVPLLTQSDQGNWSDPDARRPPARIEGRLQRYGPEFTDPYAAILDRLRADVYTACGVPALLTSPITPVSAYREARRSWLESTIAPLLEVAAEQLSEQLEERVSLTLAPSRSVADLVSRSRAYNSLVRGGMNPERAEQIAGLPS